MMPLHVKKNTSAIGKPKGRTTAAKTPRPKEKRGGAEWEAFRKRLGLLIEQEPKRAQFARKCDVTQTMLNAWEYGRALPGAAQLRKLARAASVSLDWLLDGVGHDGTPSPDVIYRGQERSNAALAADLAAYVKRAVAENPHPLIAHALDSKRPYVTISDDEYLTMAVEATITLIRNHFGAAEFALAQNRVTFSREAPVRRA